LAWNGSQLNSPRQISMAVFTGADRLVNYTLAVMQFGQFINHDMELTNQFTYRN
jgi:Animal haem peroxidase